MPSTNNEIIEDWLDLPGTKLILQKLMESAQRSQQKYDKCETYDEFKKLQIYRSVILHQIPKVIEIIIKEHEPKWKFWQWLGNSLTLGEQNESRGDSTGS